MTLSHRDKNSKYSPIVFAELYGWLAYLESLFYNFSYAEEALKKMDGYINNIKELNKTSYYQLLAFRYYVYTSILHDKREYNNALVTVKKGIELLQKNDVTDVFC